MKQSYFNWGIFIVLFLVISCTSEPTASDTQPDVSAYSTTLQQIFNDGKGVFRGINFDVNMNELREVEKAEFMKVTANKLLYHIELNQHDFIDIAYEFGSADKQLQSIVTDVFVEKADVAADLYEELKKYFNERYTPHPAFWKGKDLVNNLPYKVELVLLNNPKDYGVVMAWTKVAD